jgi:hypothetical protein
VPVGQWCTIRLHFFIAPGLTEKKKTTLTMDGPGPDLASCTTEKSHTEHSGLPRKLAGSPTVGALGREAQYMRKTSRRLFRNGHKQSTLVQLVTFQMDQEQALKGSVFVEKKLLTGKCVDLSR